MTLRLKFTLALLGMGILPLVALLVLVLFTGQPYVEKSIVARLQDNVAHATETINQYMLTALHDFRVFGADSAQHTGSDLSRHLTLLVKEYPHFTRLLFCDTDGVIVAASGPDFIGRPLTEFHPELPSVFERMLTTEPGQVFLSDLAEDTHMAEEHEEESDEEESDEDQPDIELVTNVTDTEDRLLGILVGVASTDLLAELLADLYRRTPGDEHVYLLSPGGEVLLTTNPQTPLFSPYPDAEHLSGTSGNVTYVNAQGREVVTSYADIGRYGANRVGGWTLVDTAPYAVIMEPGIAVLRQTSVVIGATLALAAALALLLTRTLMQSVTSLTRSAAAIARGELNARASVTSRDEIGVLARSFNRMAEQVQQRTAALQIEIATRQNAERELQQAHDEQEQQVRERTAELETAFRELASISYSLSHDLRTPLRGIDGFCLALQEDYGEHLDERAQGYLRRIRAAAQRLGHLSDDLVNLLRLARHEINRTPVSLSTLAESLLAQFRKREPQRFVEVIIQDGLTAEGDETLLHAALEQLLANAWKFTEPHPSPRIEFGVDNGVYFVRDNGVGFDPAYIEKLFNPFQRLHGIDEFPGSGIGLAIVRRIVERHGGRVWAEGNINEGATFYFTL